MNRRSLSEVDLSYIKKVGYEYKTFDEVQEIVGETQLKSVHAFINRAMYFKEIEYRTPGLYKRWGDKPIRAD